LVQSPRYFSSVKLLRGQCTTDTLHGVMFNISFHRESCNRRDFITAAGVLVVGGVLSCSRKQAHNQILQIPTTPITMRVRIGKTRDPSGCTINGDQISRTARGWELSQVSKVLLETTDRGVAWINTGSHTFSISEKTNRITGKISLHPREDISTHAFDVVAHVPMESYLPGVIAGELFSHWHPNTFAAQAVAARSYASAQHLQRKTSSHFDVTDGPSSQVFLGDVTLEVAHRAVLETKGVVLTWKNTIVPAYYSACCGGLAATAFDAISNSPLHNIDPLLGRAGKDVCTSLAVHKWSIERSHRHLRKRLTKWANTTTGLPFKQLRSIQSITPAQTNKHGRPTTLQVVDQKNTVHIIGASQFVRAANTTYPTLPSPNPRLWSSNLIATRVGATVELRGRGMGHGVGLCQYGSQILAGKNKSWESILFRYYPNVALGTIKS
jgi:SpoIID/LytB domain protein